MTFITHTGLANALHAVIGMKGARGLNREWEIVLRALRHQTRLQNIGQNADDVVQASAFRILRARKPFEGAEDRQAFKFLWTIVHRAHLDIVDHKRRNDPMDHVVRYGGDDDRDPIDRLAAPDADPTRSADAPAVLEDAIDRLRGYVDEVIEGDGLPMLRRESTGLHANATILAVLDKLGVREIAETLGEPGASDACIYKWTERGRATIVRALNLWAKANDEEDAILIAELRARFLKRRKDAGHARPQRRRKEKPKR